LAKDLFYPRGGWGRAVQYIRHRVNRLPDPPERIARGIFAGVFVTFTPLYGLHFLLAFIVAKLVRGNVLAALMSTFFGNPLTYVPIAVVSLKLGDLFLGSEPRQEMGHGVMRSFLRASDDLWENFLALFSHRDAHWDRLIEFFYEVFLPFLVGGILPGLIAGAIAYYLSVPVIRAYQKRRTNRLRKRIKKRRKKAHDLADAVHESD
jgi:uncharacterized protein (DUF2062 family)